MKTSVLMAFAFVVCMVSVAFAKRSAPAKVESLRADTLEFRVPHEQMGCVEAWDTTSNKLVWRRQVYVVKYQVDLERDVQDVFITAVAREGKTLQVKNERMSEYQLDLETLQVKVIKGSLVESRQ